MPRALTEYERANFETLSRAFEDGRAAVISAEHAATGETHALLVAFSDDPAGSDELIAVPFARLGFGEDNPYELYRDPTAE